MQQRSTRLLVTGASGFVGRGLLSDLRQEGYAIRAAVRRPLGLCDEVLVGNIDADTSWSEALRDVGCVIHLAGRAHVLNDPEENPLDAFREINQEADQYTWWSNRGQARANNVGWRIDYQVLTPELRNTVTRARVYKDKWFSDHAPLIMDYEIE